MCQRIVIDKGLQLRAARERIRLQQADPGQLNGLYIAVFAELSGYDFKLVLNAASNIDFFEVLFPESVFVKDF